MRISLIVVGLLSLVSHCMEETMDREALLHYRDQLRFGRAVAVKDAEGFSEILFAVERLGSFLSNEIGTLNSYLPVIQH